MSVIVDTSVWSLALRRKARPESSKVIEQLSTLIANDQAVIIGAIRQEILSGVRHTEQFQKLQNYLGAFPDLMLSHGDYELAAEFFNTCRRNGVQGSNTDFLICAVAHRRRYSIFTTDKDFANCKAHIPIQLWRME